MAAKKQAVKDPAGAAAPAPGKIILAAGLLSLATLAAYHNSFAVPFIFDDKAAILENPSIRQWWPLDGVLSPPPEASGAAGRPIVNLSLALNHALSGEAVWSYHAFNLLVHVFAGLILFGLLRRTLATAALPARVRAAALPLSFTTTAVWLLHPLQTESVTFVIQRSELIVGFFYLLTLYGFCRAGGSRRPRLWLGISVAACALGMASKELMVSAPLLVLLYDRTFFAGSFRDAWLARRGYYAALALTWLVLAWLLMHGGGTRGEAAGFGLGVSPWEYLLTQCRAIALYLRLTFWPHPLVLDYGTAVIRSPLAVWPQGLGLLLLAGATAWACVRRPAAGFAGVAFFAILAPSSSIVPLVAQTVAEHRMYLPLAAILALVIPATHARLGRAALPVILLIIPGLMWGTVRRNHDYRSERAIWTDTVAKAPENPRARVNLAEILLLAGEPSAALEHAAAAVKSSPAFPEAQMNLGIALAQSGRPQEALQHAAEAVRLRPDSLRARSNLGVVLAMLGQLPEAVVHLEQALQLSPTPAEAVSLHANLGHALLLLGRRSEAAEQFSAVLRLDPGHPGARRALAALQGGR